MADNIYNTQKFVLVLVKKILEQQKTLKKADLSNSFIAKQCSLINNNSKLPTNFTYMTENRLDNVIFSIDEIANKI